MKIVLRAENPMGIVVGTETIPAFEDSPSKHRKWLVRDAKAQRLLTSTIDVKIHNHLVACETSAQMYTKLKTIFERDNDQQKCNLLQDFYNFKYSKDMDMIENIGKLKNVVHKLTSLNQLISEEMVITRILTALPEEYQYFSCAWDSTRKEDRTLENLCARLTAEEQKAANRDETENAFKAENKYSKDAISKMRCFKCNEAGHKKVNCPTLSKATRPCSICGKSNHLEKDCYFGKNKNEKRCAICRRTNHTASECFFKNTRNPENRISFITVWKTRS